MITQTKTPIPTTTNLVIDNEPHLHIGDDIRVNAIRNSKRVEVYCNELTEDEQRAAAAVLFNLYSY